jgi:hypothetical protein
MDGSRASQRDAENDHLDAAAKGGGQIGAGHLSFPGMGHLHAAGHGYRWIPVNFTQLH